MEGKGEYLIILRDWLCFIPEKDFKEYFQIEDQESGLVSLIEKKFEGWWGGWDTYLQSYCLDHARSSVRAGDYSSNLLGIYHLKRPNS